MAFNYAYRSLRELVPACKLNNIKFAVCQKESNFLNGELPEMLDGLRSHIDKFNGDLMTVYSERYKKLLVKTKVVKNRITKVVGMQRADKFFSSDFRPKQTYVLIFLIQTYRGLFKQNKKAIKFGEVFSDSAVHEGVKPVAFMRRAFDGGTTEVIDDVAAYVRMRIGREIIKST